MQTQKVVRLGPHRVPMCIKIDEGVKSRFRETCALRGVSQCHVAEALFEAWVVGQKAEATLVRPVTVNLTMEHVVQRPRRMIDAWQPKVLLWPPCCEHADKFIKSTREVGCLDSKEFIGLKECWFCFRRRSMLSL